MTTIDIGWLQTQFPDLDSLVPIGPGGQKIVLQANHKVDGAIVLKLYRMGSDEEVVLREVAAPELVASHRVPRIFDTGKVASPLGEIFWLREQRIPGVSLREVIARGPLDARALLRLSLHVLEALTAAESARIVHRDVKPDNIIAGDDGDFWLIDFGLARHLDLTSMTATALAWGKGTPGYMPLEQWRNHKRDIDARADLFGFGVTLYEGAEGTNPFREGARNALEMLRRTERLLLPALQRDVDSRGEFRNLVLAMTRTAPNHRISSAKDALEWIQEICVVEGIGS